ncbi:putative major facilitator superfamily transporter [Streptomyces sp. NBRC 110611]|uniref:MFS transporter n=1 Tax=Streptomyces sp. NBRC 110611 TaxID=1621259 RepID=UPI00082A77C6|nr:MFS transporter [Streptomyces sp. NBRC 110611]GAU67211.1 putative major facilitator superfamily transporter [Streptomyces sp. NBRC 110611]
MSDPSTGRPAPLPAEAPSDHEGGPAGAGRDFGARLMTPLLLGSLLNPLNSTMIATALVAIGQDFRAGAADTVWLISVMYLSSAVGQPSMGRLADRVGPRRVFIAGALSVCAAGLIGALAPTFTLLIVSRVVLGLGTSAAYPAAMALLRAESRRVGRPTPRRVLGRLSLAALGSAAVGPALGGLLTAAAGWRAVFAINVPLALLALAGALAWLPADRGARGERTGTPGSLDPLGIGLFAGALTCAMFFLLRLEDPRWPLLAPAGVLTAALVWWQLRHPAPFLDLRMLARNGALVRTYLRQGLTYLVIYCVLYGFSQWLEEAHGYSPFHAGLVMLPMSGAAALCSIAGARTRGIRAPLTAAAACLTAGSAVFLLLRGDSPLPVLLCAGALVGIPQGLAATGNQAAVYAQAPADGVGAAAGLQRTAQYLGAIVASSLIGLLYGQRASDPGLHQIAVIGVVLGVLLLALTLTDRTLRARQEP